MKIGVIGGNGVAATNRLCDLVERKITGLGAFRDQHHPEMLVWYATKAPSRSMFLEGRGPSWIPDYVRIATCLKTLGCDIGCMCCNTAHYAIDEIQRESGLRFINLLEAIAEECKRSGHDKFELLCTEGARKFDLYGRVFKKVYPAAQIDYPSLERQKLVTKVICDVKNKARFSDSPEISPIALLKRIVEEGNLPIILGCTDLSVAFAPEETLSGNVVIDSLDVLASRIVDIHCQEELQPIIEIV